MGNTVGETWRPWRELRSRADIDFALADLPPPMRALWCRDPDTGARAILVARHLSPAERLEALAHELVHDERGGSGHRADMPDLLCAGVEREERRTDEIVAERLLPDEVLRKWVRAEVELGQEVTVIRCAERFEVSEAVAYRSLIRLALAA